MSQIHFMCVVCGFYAYSDIFFFFKQKTAYEMRISDWSSDVCSSDLHVATAEEALAEIEHDVVLHHQEEALVRRLVEAKLALQFGDELRPQPLGAAVGAGGAGAGGDRSSAA